MVCSFMWWLEKLSKWCFQKHRPDLLCSHFSVASGREMVTRYYDDGVMCYQEQRDWKFLQYSASRLTYAVDDLSVSDSV